MSTGLLHLPSGEIRINYLTSICVICVLKMKTVMNVRKQYRTDALIPNTGFWFGFLSVFSFFSAYQATTYGHLSDAELDAMAMRADWGAVATDAQEALQATGIHTKKYTTQQLSFKF